MKQYQKIIAGALMLAILGTTGSASTLNRAAQRVDVKALERYSNFESIQVEGRWQARTYQAEGLLDRFWTYGRANGTAMCIFNLEIEGQGQTGIWTPVLRFYYVNGRAIHASAVSILIDGVRYDLAAASEEVTDDGYRTEVISAPLNVQSVQVLEALLNGESVAIRLMGDRVYTTALDRDTTNSRRRIEAASLSGLGYGVDLMARLGGDDYNLWDLSDGLWQVAHGFEPAFQKITVENTLGDTPVSDDFGMVIYASQTRASRVAQEYLIEWGMMSGTANATFGESALAATRRAQRYLGRIETGGMDGDLVRAMDEALSGSEGRESRENLERDVKTLGQTAMIALDRYWFAESVSAEKGLKSLYSASNGDNVLLIADGWIQNISDSEMRLFTQLDAQIVYNDQYRFEAHILCQRDEGAALDVSLLPLAQSRMIVYGEVPGWLADQADGVWRMEIANGGESLEYELQ